MLPSIRVFSNDSVRRIRWPKYWSFSFSISPSNERSGLISFGMDWLDLLAVQGTLKSLLQHHSSKANVKLPQTLLFKAQALSKRRLFIFPTLSPLFSPCVMCFTQSLKSNTSHSVSSQENWKAHFPLPITFMCSLCTIILLLKYKSVNLYSSL